MSTDPRELAQKAHTLLVQILQTAQTGSTVDIARRHMEPRPDDYAKAFVADVAESVRQVYTPLWASGQLDPRPKRGQTEIRLWAATSEDLKLWNANARQFPGGYEGIAQHLNPGRIWFRWKFVEPGETLGMAFDGLVWMDDHWAWFPKPWRAIRMGGGSEPMPPAIGEA